MTRWITFVLAVAGVGLALVAVRAGSKKPPAPIPVNPPPINPFGDGIAASGLIESVSRNVVVSPAEGGVVVEVPARVGQRVEAGQPLFRLDDRIAVAELASASAALVRAQAELDRLRALPRPEEVAIHRRAVLAAEATLGDALADLERQQRATQRGAMNEEDLARARFAADRAQALRDQAQAQLELTLAGAWEPDLAIAQSAVEQARAKVLQSQAALDRLTVISPMASTVLRRNVEPGQFAMPGAASMSQAAFVLGDLSELRVRARVDEDDATQLAMGARALARPRGQSEIAIAVTMLWIEPMATPKQDLTGMASERVDSRVVEVVLSISDTGGVVLYPGMLVDVFFERRPTSPDETEGAGTADERSTDAPPKPGP